MKKSILNNIKIALILIPVILITSSIEFLPWWFFLVPVLIFGIIINYLKLSISIFYAGFIPGFLIWAGATTYYDLTFNGIILNKIALLLSIHKIIIIGVTGIIGGLLVALSLYTGKGLFSYNKNPSLDEE